MSLSFFYSRHQKIALYVAACLIFFACSSNLRATESESPATEKIASISNGRYRISGGLTLETYSEFEAALKRHPEIQALEFVDSEGSARNADSIVNLFQLKIDELHLTTYAKGYCVSTCGFIFLMGRKRVLLKGSEDKPTIIKLHPIFNSQLNEFETFSTDKYIQEISSRSGGKISKEYLKKMYLTTDRRGGLIIKREAGANGKHIFFQAKYGDQLDALSSQSLAELGLVTED